MEKVKAALESELQDFKPSSAACVKVTVHFEKGKLIASLGSILYREFERMVNYANHPVLARLSEKDIQSYLCTLMYLRIAKASSTEDKTTIGYRPYYRTYAVPVLFYQLLVSIGVCYDRDYNLEFVPAYTIEQEDLLSPQRMKEISDEFRAFEDRGMKIVGGLPKDPSGELDLMAMCHVTDEVVSYRKSHPVYGFLAAFLAEKELNQITGTMCRIVYGYETDYEARLRILMNAINRV